MKFKLYNKLNQIFNGESLDQLEELSFEAAQGNLRKVKRLAKKQRKNLGAEPIIAEMLDYAPHMFEGLRESGIGKPGGYVQDSMEKTLAHDYQKIAETLIKYGAPIDGVDLDGRTGLMNAARAGLTNVYNALAAAGADGAIKDRQGKTAADYAAERKASGARPIKTFGYL